MNQCQARWKAGQALTRVRVCLWSLSDPLGAHVVLDEKGANNLDDSRDYENYSCDPYERSQGQRWPDEDRKAQEREDHASEDEPAPPITLFASTNEKGHAAQEKPDS